MARFGRRQPNKPIIVTGHPLGNPAVPTPAHPVRVLLTNARKAGRILLQHNRPLGNPAVPTPIVQPAHIFTSNARRGTGRILLAHGLMVSTVIPAPPPHVHLTNTRRAGHAIVLRTPGAIGNPAQPTPKPQVHQTNRRQAGRIIVTRPEGVLGVPGFTAHAAPPIIVSRSSRRPGVTVLFRTPGAVGLPAVSTPQPHVIAVSRRQPGRIVVLGQHVASPVIPAPPPIVHRTNARRAGIVQLLRTPGAIGNPAQPTPKPHIISRAMRLAGRILLPKGTTPPPPPFTIGILTGGTAETSELTGGTAETSETTGGTIDIA